MIAISVRMNGTGMKYIPSEHFHITGKGVNFAIHNCEYENLDKSFHGTGKEVRDCCLMLHIMRIHEGWYF